MLPGHFLNIRNLRFFTTLVLLAIFAFNTTFAQQPAFYKLGEDELNGIDIYDLIQDSSNNYWIASDHGIIKFNGYKFQNIPSDGLINNSLFDLQMDYNGTIYCKNLSGPIFKIENDSLKLFFDVPDSLQSSDIRYSFDNKNALILSAKSLVRISESGEIQSLYKPNIPFSFHGDIVQLEDSTLLLYDQVRAQFLYVKDKTLTQQKILSPIIEANIQPTYFNDSLVYIDLSSEQILHKKDNRLLISTKSKVLHDGLLKRYYSEGANLWLALFSGGLKVYDSDLEPLFGGNIALKNTIISSFLRDFEGNIILGTFGEGLVVIPNSELMNFDLPDPTERVMKITSNLKNEVYLGTQSGAIYKIDSLFRLTSLMNGLEKNIELLEYISEDNGMLYDAKEPVYLNLTSGWSTQIIGGSVKDVERLEDNLYIIGTHVGVQYFLLSGKSKNPEIQNIKTFNIRNYCVNRNEFNQLIYAGTSDGLMVGTESSVDQLFVDGKSLMCNDIKCHNEMTYVATQNEGLVIFKGRELVSQWKTTNGLLSNAINQIKIYNNQLFLATTKGFQIVDFNGNTKTILGKSEGLRANNIFDFEICNKRLWLVHQKGVQFIELDQFKAFDYIPSVQISQFFVNDSEVSLSKELSFSHKHNRLTFVVTTKNLKYSSETDYLFKLEGIDLEWQKQTYLLNSMHYKSLPPGSYQFKVKSIYRGRESKVQVLSFVVAQPFWNSWWFYGFILTAFISITLLIYRIQINRHQRKVQFHNELNASKLIAIQSQMNPHFIFNAINSIQDLILKGDIENSYSYIVKLSNLVRQTLNFSSKEFIDIHEEVELLTIYLELEKLRFNEDFDYTIIIENCEGLCVPPMLVQPFAENAIKHGLLHKDGPKMLIIEFKKGEKLTCLIEDNGIGRDKAEEIKQRQKKVYGSFSVSAIKKRFKIMRSQYKADIGINYIDKLENGRSAGTKVVIDMPFKRRY